MISISIDQLATIVGGQQAEAQLPTDNLASGAVRNGLTALGEDLANCQGAVKVFSQNFDVAPYDYNTGAIKNNFWCKRLMQDLPKFDALPQSQPGR